MSDDNRFHDSHGLIAEIFLRHRHNYIQAICSSQKWRSLSTAVRGQACWICMWSMRSADERKAALNEFNGMYPMKIVEQFLEEATRERFNFLYVNLLAPTREEAFFLRISNTGYCHDFVSSILNAQNTPWRRRVFPKCSHAGSKSRHGRRQFF